MTLTITFKAGDKVKLVNTLKIRKDSFLIEGSTYTVLYFDPDIRQVTIKEDGLGYIEWRWELVFPKRDYANFISKVESNV